MCFICVSFNIREIWVSAFSNSIFSQLFCSNSFKTKSCFLKKKAPCYISCISYKIFDGFSASFIGFFILILPTKVWERSTVLQIIFKMIFSVVFQGFSMATEVTVGFAPMQVWQLHHPCHQWHHSFFLLSFGIPITHFLAFLNCNAMAIIFLISC